MFKSLVKFNIEYNRIQELLADLRTEKEKLVEQGVKLLNEYQ